MIPKKIFFTKGVGKHKVMWKQMWFAKICPICKKKVEKSELKKIETVRGAEVTCCTNCVKYFKVR